MDPDVIEIPPPTLNPTNFMKHKEAIMHNVIDIDNDDDSLDLVLVGENVGSSKNKGKAIESIHDGYGDHQTMEQLVDIFEACNGYTSTASHDLIDVDDDGSEHSYDDEDDDDDYSDFYTDDNMVVDKYALIQAHFDNVDIPPGIEAPIPWLAEYELGLKKSGSSSLYPSSHTQSDATNSQVSNPYQPSWSPAQGPPPPAGGSCLQIKTDAINHPSGLESSSPQLFSQTAPGKKNRRRRKLKLALGMESSQSSWFPGPSMSKKKPIIFGASTNHGFVDNSKTMMKLPVPHGGEPPYWGQLEIAKKAIGSNTPYLSNSTGPVDGSLHFSGESANPWWLKNPYHFKPIPNYTANQSFPHPFDPFDPHPEQAFDNTWVHNSVSDGNDGTNADIAVQTISDEARDEILRKFQNFKQFDTVEDTSDHYFVHANSSMKQPPKNWAKRIQEEWKSLEKDLPDSIFVRVYESRIDLLRAVIIGAEGTPYHDGLFFFDVFFPSGYPNVPPNVHYHSGGLRLNPNLYNCGKVCLSLLNTWSGSKNEKWLPGVSTILQVLVSIQGLILNTKPYFNEPGYARLSGSADGEMRSLNYNEDTFILSLKTMVYMMRRPPKNFEDFVVGHFCSRAHDILVACKAYMDGAQVGCLVKGGVQDVDQGDRSCSKKFKKSLAAYVDMLAREFTKVGAKDCEKFSSSSTIAGNKPFAEAEVPVAAAVS